MSENYKKTSPIWEHFSMIDTINAKCNICKNSFSYKSSITNLKKHMKNKHPTVQIEQNSLPNKNNYINDNVTSNPNTTMPDSGATSSSGATAVVGVTNHNEPGNSQQGVKRKCSMRQETLNFAIKKMSMPTKLNIDSELMKMFTKDFQPFSIVEDRGFVGFVKALNPSYVLPNRHKISQSMLPALYEKIKNEIKESAKLITKCSLTTDCWTSCNNESFLGITFHYINDNFNMESRVLGCVSYNESHTGSNLALKIKQMTDDWDLTNKICLAVSDNAANIKSAIKSILKWEHFGCLAHTINLIVKNALKGLVSPLLDKVKKIVIHFKKSSSANYKFLNYQRNNFNTTEPKKLILDVETRWNSTFYMLERFFELQEVIKATVAVLDKNLPILTQEEWKIINNLIKVLKPFECITKLVSGEKYLTASMIIVLVNGLKNNMAKIRLQIDEPSDEIETFISSLREGINKKFEFIEDQDIICIATFLDPRFKTIAFLNEAAPDRVKKLVISAITTKLSNAVENVEVIETPQKSIDETSIWSLYDETAWKIKPKATEKANAANIEVQRYLEEDLLERRQDPLLWWQKNSHNYPNLSLLAKETLCATATSVPCERLFSKAGNILTDRRTRLKSKTVEKILFLNQNQTT